MLDMLGQMIDMVLYPVTQFLLMLKDDRIAEFLGVSVLGIAVTCMIVLIVFRSLVSTVNPGEVAASIGNRRVRSSRSHNTSKDNND